MGVHTFDQLLDTLSSQMRFTRTTLSKEDLPLRWQPFSDVQNWRIKMKYEGRTYTTYFAGGEQARPVECKDVLHSCFQNSWSVLHFDGAEEYAAELGKEVNYDEWNLLCAESIKFRRFLGQATWEVLHEAFNCAIEERI